MVDFPWPCLICLITGMRHLKITSIAYLGDRSFRPPPCLAMSDIRILPSMSCYGICMYICVYIYICNYAYYIYAYTKYIHNCTSIISRSTLKRLQNRYPDGEPKRSPPLRGMIHPSDPAVSVRSHYTRRVDVFGSSHRVPQMDQKQRFIVVLYGLLKFNDSRI